MTLRCCDRYVHCIGILFADVPLSYGIIDINVSSQHLNKLEIVWDPQQDVGVFIKVHCISTEFTARKHGGEKGVPFRIQLETYIHCPINSVLLNAASCQIKVFKVTVIHGGAGSGCDKSDQVFYYRYYVHVGH